MMVTATNTRSTPTAKIITPPKVHAPNKEALIINLFISLVWISWNGWLMKAYPLGSPEGFIWSVTDLGGAVQHAFNNWKIETRDELYLSLTGVVTAVATLALIAYSLALLVFKKSPFIRFLYSGDFQIGAGLVGALAKTTSYLIYKRPQPPEKNES